MIKGVAVSGVASANDALAGFHEMNGEGKSAMIVGLNRRLPCRW